jgi:hypothetical protein
LKKYQRKMRDRFYCMVALLFFALIPFMTMAATPTASPLSSGIEGVVLISPSRPGPTRLDQPNATPAPNVTFAVMRDNARIASLTTDAEGRFRLLVPPGHYTVLRDDPGAKIGHWRFEADVKPGEVTRVRWTADSGMR